MVRIARRGRTILKSRTNDDERPVSSTTSTQKLTVFRFLCGRLVLLGFGVPSSPLSFLILLGWGVD